MLVLVRHTAVTLVEGLAPSEWPASPAGVAEAERLASAPVFSALAAIASSPERKALATAEPIARRLGLEVVVEPDLREVGRPPGPIVSAEEIGRRVRAYLDEGRLDGWEPATAARERVDACIARLRRTADGPLAVVSHGLLLTLLRRDTAGLWESMPLPAVAIGPSSQAVGPWLSVEQALALRSAL